MTGLRKDYISWITIFMFGFFHGFLLMMPKILTLFGYSLMMNFLITWFLWSNCLVCQVSMLLIWNGPWMIFIFGRRAWSIAKIWYFPLFVEKISWLRSLVCLQCWLRELFLCKVKRIFSYFLWKLENFWHRLFSVGIQIHWLLSYAIVLTRKSF
jgi:hypothetical protein